MPRKIFLQLNPTPGCGVSQFTFDITCVEAVSVRVTPVSGGPSRSNCIVLEAPVASLHDFISMPELQALSEVETANGPVRVELRAFHGVGADGCANPKAQMFWGVSESVDLSAPGLTKIRMPVDCRPGCNCADIDEKPGCALDITAGVCAPLPNFRCRRNCTTRGTCPKPLICDQQTKICIAREGGTCSDCAVDADCNDGICVRNSNDKIQENFCAALCPATNATRVCGEDLSCEPLDSDPFEPVE